MFRFLTVPAILLLFSTSVLADQPKRIIHPSDKTFELTVQKLRAAIKGNGMGLVSEACATCGAKSIGITIPGNRVLMVFHPKFAVRMLEADVDAGFEAPLRIYVTEAKDKSVQISYLPASTVFAPYKNEDLNVMAAELDEILANILRDSLK